MADQKLVMTVLAAADVPQHWGETKTHALASGGLLDPQHERVAQRVVSHTVTPLDGGMLLLTFVVEPE